MLGVAGVPATCEEKNVLFSRPDDEISSPEAKNWVGEYARLVLIVFTKDGCWSKEDSNHRDVDDDRHSAMYIARYL